MDKINYEDFQKLDIRIGEIVSAEKLPDSNKLLKLIIDLGEEKRQLIAGIGKAFPEPAELVGRQIPILANLEPKELAGHMSEGMILAADSEDGLPVLLHPQGKVQPGSKVH